MPFRLFVSNYKWSLSCLKFRRRSSCLLLLFTHHWKRIAWLAYKIHYYCWRNNKKCFKKKKSKNRHRQKSFCILLAFFMQQWTILSNLFLTLATTNREAYVFLLFSFFCATKCFIYFHLCSTSRYSPLSLPRPPHSHSNLHYLWTFKSTQSPFFND
jgi:hypothetical protein